LSPRLCQKVAAGSGGREADLAEGGDMSAIRYIMDRVDGRPEETVNLENMETKLMGVFNGA
jgi:hypothetical protein